jgi:hypothetical protein
MDLSLQKPIAVVVVIVVAVVVAVVVVAVVAVDVSDLHKFHSLAVIGDSQMYSDYIAILQIPDITQVTQTLSSSRLNTITWKSNK